MHEEIFPVDDTPEQQPSDHEASDETSDLQSRRTFLTRFKRWMLGVNAVVISAAAYKGCELAEQRNKLDALNAERQRLRDEISKLKKKSRPMPEHVANDPELRAFLEERFEVVAGTATIEDAKVICWGDYHFIWQKSMRDLVKPEDVKLGLRSVNTIAMGMKKTLNDGDHVLMEGAGPEENLNAIPQDMRPLIYPGFIATYMRNFTMSGWDDKELVQQHLAAIRRGDLSASQKLLLKRDDAHLYPNIIEAARTHDGKIHVVAGVAHLDDDPRIDAALQEEDIPYIILASKEAQDKRRERAGK